MKIDAVREYCAANGIKEDFTYSHSRLAQFMLVAGNIYCPGTPLSGSKLDKNLREKSIATITVIPCPWWGLVDADGHPLTGDLSSITEPIKHGFVWKDGVLHWSRSLVVVICGCLLLSILQFCMLNLGIPKGGSPK